MGRRKERGGTFCPFYAGAAAPIRPRIHTFARKNKNPCCLAGRTEKNASPQDERCFFRPRSRQGTGQFSEDLTYPDKAGITVTDSRGLSPHSTCKHEACANCPISIFYIIPQIQLHVNAICSANMPILAYFAREAGPRQSPAASVFASSQAARSEASPSKPATSMPSAAMQ